MRKRERNSNWAASLKLHFSKWAINTEVQTPFANTWAHRMNFRMQQKQMEQKSCGNNELARVGSFWQQKHSLSLVKIQISLGSFSYLATLCFLSLSRQLLCNIWIFRANKVFSETIKSLMRFNVERTWTWQRITKPLCLPIEKGRIRCVLCFIGQLGVAYSYCHIDSVKI